MSSSSQSIVKINHCFEKIWLHWMHYAILVKVSWDVGSITVPTGWQLIKLELLSTLVADARDNWEELWASVENKHPINYVELLDWQLVDEIWMIVDDPDSILWYDVRSSSLWDELRIRDQDSCKHHWRHLAPHRVRDEASISNYHLWILSKLDDLLDSSRIIFCSEQIQSLKNSCRLLRWEVFVWISKCISHSMVESSIELWIIPTLCWIANCRHWKSLVKHRTDYWSQLLPISFILHWILEEPPQSSWGRSKKCWIHVALRGLIEEPVMEPIELATSAYVV